MALPFAVQIRIADELQANLNLASWLREALENALGAQYGVGKNGEPPKCGLDTKLIQSWRAVVKAMEALGTLKIKLDKNAKQMAEQMSSEEELEAVRSYIRSINKDTRGRFLRYELEWHDKH